MARPRDTNLRTVAVGAFDAERRASMGRKHYLGGSTITGPSDNPYRLENTAPLRIEGEPCEKAYFHNSVRTGSLEEWRWFGLGPCSDMLEVVQMAVLAWDPSLIMRAAAEGRWCLEPQDILLAANALLQTRKFIARGGKVTMVRIEQKLIWNRDALRNLYRAAELCLSDPGEEASEMPDLDSRFVAFILDETMERPVIA